MKRIANFTILSSLIVSMPASRADCLYPITRYTVMRVESCASATESALANTEGKGYTESEIATVKLSATNISIIRALPISDVDIILWYSDGNQRLFKGKTRSLSVPKARDYVLLGVAPDQCKQLYVGKVRIFEPYTG